jgi:hypothetical protein
MYWITAGAVVFITVYRLLMPSPAGATRSPGTREAEGATL